MQVFPEEIKFKIRFEAIFFYQGRTNIKWTGRNPYHAIDFFFISDVIPRSKGTDIENKTFEKIENVTFQNIENKTFEKIENVTFEKIENVTYIKHRKYNVQNIENIMFKTSKIERI